ncbi:hypothetical protein [Streptomyces mirabilis]|uniref:hypothetical protein n=1 Tax=Streptomyces mirabilis TaxID=68239 RepID=UPI00224D6695|nr:hypothetical protein [Streptomyces mirabilis]MCX4419263.1 IS110 family transposase [Streptomyces mirabilis]
MDTIGGILATLTIPTDTGGFRQLLDRATSFGKVLAFGVEGTGSYGATLASFLRRAGHAGSRCAVRCTFTRSPSFCESQ